MGGSYSDLNVYLRTKNDRCSRNGYTLTSAKKNFDGCCSFVVFTHTISFSPSSSGRNYNVILYDGDKSNNGNYVFGYYYPGNDNEVIQEVRGYYSVLAPNHPLVISFVTKANKNYNCLPKNLKNARWNYASNITAYSSLGPNLTKEVLDEEFKKLLLNRTIKFTTGSDNKDIAAAKQEIKHKNFRLIFLPKGNESVLGLNCLFSLDFEKNEPKPESKENNKNQIDPYFLDSVKGQYYDGIIVYFAGDDKRKYKSKDTEGTVLLLEFIDHRKNNICLRRKDSEGYWWAEEKVDCNDDKKLITKLSEIKRTADTEQVVTVILDKKEKYTGVKQFHNDEKQPFNKYTFTFDKPNKPVFLFKKTKLNFDPFTKLTTKTKSIEVFYLKAGGEDDTQPFLIIFEPDDRIPNTKKACHFKDTYNFEDWVDFEFDFDKLESVKPGADPEKDLVKKLYEKVQKIETNGSCVPELSLLRWYAHQILIDPEISKPPDPPTEPPQRPPEQQPSPTTEPLNIPLIAGCTVGGVVFVISSAVGYGVYWYNTTIKLLT